PGGAKRRRFVFCFHLSVLALTKTSGDLRSPAQMGHPDLRESWWRPAWKAIIERCPSPYSSWICPLGMRSSFATCPTCFVPMGRFPSSHLLLLARSGGRFRYLPPALEPVRLV